MKISFSLIIASLLILIPILDSFAILQCQQNTNHSLDDLMPYSSSPAIFKSSNSFCGQYLSIISFIQTSPAAICFALSFLCFLISIFVFLTTAILTKFKNLSLARSSLYFLISMVVNLITRSLLSFQLT